METNPRRGIYCMMGAMLLISVQEALAKYLGEFLPVMQVVWARYLGHLILMTLLLWPKYHTALLRSGKLSTQVGRSLILLVDTVLFFLGLTMLGLAEATAIFFTVPLLVLLLSIPLLGEKFSVATTLAIIIGFIGTLIIVRPGVGSMASSSAWLGALSIFGSACCAAAYNVTTRKLSGNDPLPVTLFYTALVGALATSLWVPFVWQSPPTITAWVALFSIGLFGGMAHSLIILAHKYATATTVAPFMYSQIFWALALGWLLFDDLPDLLAYFGGGIVIGSGLYLFYRDWCRSKAVDKTLV